MNQRQPFERLEQRRLLSASFRGAVDSAVADRYADIAVEQVRQALPEASLAVSSSFARASDLDLYEPAELTQARQWVFIGEGDVAGATVEPSGVIDGVSIATFNNPANAMAALEASGSEAFYPLEARQQSRRVIPNDTRFNDQWHLRNTGQSGGLVGADANITDVWDTYRGAGVTIGIVDDGLHFDHPDLAPQYVAADSFDFNDNDPIPFASSPFDFHGTSVAGIAAARGFDGAGVTGAAPEANLSGLRLISGPSNDSQEAGALSFNNQSIDIYSNSWGPFDDGRRIEGPGPLTLAAIEQTATEGRDGLGGIITWAGGNGGDGDDSNRDGYANSRHTISVAAVNNFGVRSSYSEPGANHLVTAYSSGGSRGTTTTDGSNGFTNSFGGTSSATPLVSGVIALMLEANPDLTQRDVQHILVESAETIDPTDSSWQTNGAGHDVSVFYGHGAIDAEAAVNLALNWETVGDEISVDAFETVNQTIPENSTGITRTLTLPAGVDIEHIEVVLDITHGYRGDVVATLTSPDGTVSPLLRFTGQQGDSGNNYNNWVVTSTQHWGESSEGDWTLQLSDGFVGDIGVINSWGIAAFGTSSASPVNVLASDYDVDASQAVTFEFDKDVGASLDASDLVVTNADTGNVVAVTPSLSYDAIENVATFEFGNLPDGNYVAMLPAAAAEADGQPLVGDVSVPFFVLAADANADRVVDLSDFGILRSNFGSAGLFSDGDFNYDGTVDLADFGILRAQFGSAVAEPSSSLFADDEA